MNWNELNDEIGRMMFRTAITGSQIRRTLRQAKGRVLFECSIPKGRPDH